MIISDSNQSRFAQREHPTIEQFINFMFHFMVMFFKIYIYLMGRTNDIRYHALDLFLKNFRDKTSPTAGYEICVSHVLEYM